MRDETDHPIPKPPGLIRVLVLGDSFTFGHGNAYEDIWPVIMEKSLREKGFPVDVVKAGVWAYGIRAEFLYLKRLLPVYEPDIVVIAFLPNDFRSAAPVDSSSAVGEGLAEAPEAEQFTR